MSCTLKYRFPILGYTYSCLEYLDRKTEYLRPLPRISSRVSDMFQRIKHYIFPHRLVNIFPVIAAQCCATRSVHTSEIRIPTVGGGNDESCWARHRSAYKRETAPKAVLSWRRDSERNFQTLLQCCIMKQLAARVLHTAFRFYNQR